MKILQHYYTSFINQTNGNAGFQVKALSPEISSDAQNLILRLISYRIPSSLDERAYTTHPCALRYYPFSQRESLLICSQSIGNDPNGRPGNFFAHTLVVDPQVFTTIPPVLYWKSAFWLREDPQPRFQLKPLPDFPGDPALNSESIWDFLRPRKHLAYFGQLMSAVVQGTSKRQRIIIIDSDERVALWVAALSCLLPPAYRSLLSFTTYHHDPYQSLFFITGILPSEDLRLTSEDYASYFILNTYEDRVSEIEISPYARLAQRFAAPDHDENEMLTFFSRYAQRFPAPTALGPQLDAMVYYAEIMEGAREHATSPQDLQAIDLVLQAFEQFPEPGPEEGNPQDIADLGQLGDFLWRTYETSGDRDAHRLHKRVVALLHLYHASTSRIFEKQLLHHTTQIFKNPATEPQKPVPTPAETLTNIENLRETYGQQQFRHQVNQPEYLHVISSLTGQSQISHLTAIWKSIGSDLLPLPEKKELLVQSIQIWDTNRKEASERQADPSQHQELFLALNEAIRMNKSAWLTILASNTLPKVEPKSAGHFYLKLVSELSPAQRETYREILRPILPEIVSLEVHYDLRRADAQTALPEMRQWLTYARKAAFEETSSTLLAVGLRSLSRSFRNRPQEWMFLARQFLVDAQISHLLDNEWTAQLFHAAFAQIALASFDSEHLAFYQQYAQQPSLSANARLILRTLLAMASQQIPEQDIPELHNYVRSLSHEDYTQELRSFCQVFFTPRLNDENHFRFLMTFYRNRQAHTFWSVYWGALFTLPPRITLHWLTFWFTPQALRLPHAYITQDFLLSFWQCLLIYRKQTDTQETIELLEQCKWYQVLQEGSLTRQNALLTLGKDLIKQMQKRLPYPKEEAREEQRRDLQESTRKLFVKGEIHRNHLLILLKIYRKHSPAIFWEVYRERLSKMLFDTDAELALEFFSFWFDEAFRSLTQEPYLAHSFFVNLPLALQQAAKTNEADITKVQHKMGSFANRVDSSYPWYPLLKNVFPAAPDPRSRWFGR